MQLRFWDAGTDTPRVIGSRSVPLWKKNKMVECVMEVKKEMGKIKQKPQNQNKIAKSISTKKKKTSPLPPPPLPPLRHEGRDSNKVPCAWSVSGQKHNCSKTKHKKKNNTDLKSKEIRT